MIGLMRFYKAGGLCDSELNTQQLLNLAQQSWVRCAFTWEENFVTVNRTLLKPSDANFLKIVGQKKRKVTVFNLSTPLITLSDRFPQIKTILLISSKNVMSFGWQPKRK